VAGAPVCGGSGTIAWMGWRERLGRVIFETDTPAARAFDVALLWAIVASVVAVVLESVPSIRADYGPVLRRIEWAFTLAFTVEYVLRLLTAGRERRYAFSFFGLVDLLAILPAYLALLLGASPYLAVLRALRLLRVFRVFKLARYLGEASVLAQALLASRAKITVFLTFVLTSVLVVGAAMYVIEGPARGFDSIPTSVYWAIVTLTTVGYGDISPQTPLGRTLAAALMIVGYGVIAVPTGIVTTELVRAGDRREAAQRQAAERRICGDCGLTGHGEDAQYCRRCGAALPERSSG
jgi:voltage-gated potassium channel